jgi:transcriptional regulator with XRE-family HTH domain
MDTFLLVLHSIFYVFNSHFAMDKENFTVLENKTIGKNISMYRKIRGAKANDVADRLGISESSYTRYERGEAAITVDLVQQIAEVLSVDPLMLLSVSPTNFIENCSHFAMHDYHNHQNEQQNQVIIKLMENVLAISEKLMAILDKQK